MNKDQVTAKVLEVATSVKFWILVTTTVFFYLGKLSESTWQETMLVVAGLRAVNEVAATLKKPAATKESVKRGSIKS